MAPHGGYDPIVPALGLPNSKHRVRVGSCRFMAQEFSISCSSLRSTVSAAFDEYLRSYRVRNVATVMRLMMERLDLGPARPLAAVEHDIGAERHPGDPFGSVCPLAHDPDGGIFVRHHRKAALRSQPQKEKQVAAGQCGHKCFLRVDCGWVGEGRADRVRRGGTPNASPAVE